MLRIRQEGTTQPPTPQRKEQRTTQTNGHINKHAHGDINPTPITQPRNQKSKLEPVAVAIAFTAPPLLLLVANLNIAGLFQAPRFLLGRNQRRGRRNLAARTCQGRDDSWQPLSGQSRHPRSNEATQSCWLHAPWVPWIGDGQRWRATVDGECGSRPRWAQRWPCW